MGLPQDVIQILDEDAEPVLTFGLGFGRQAETVFQGVEPESAVLDLHVYDTLIAATGQPS